MRQENVQGRPVISNCGTPTEKVSEFLDSQLKLVMESSRSYIKDSGDFIKKTKNISTIPKDSILVTADFVGLYPSIRHNAGLKALEKALNDRTNKKVLTEDLVKMAKFSLKNNYFEFNGKVKQQILRTAIKTKLTTPYACIFMDKVETSFLETQEMSSLVWFRYIDDVLFVWTHVEEKRDSFLEELNRCNSYLKFAYESSKTSIPFLDLKVILSKGTFPLICTSNRQIDTSFYFTHHLILIILNTPLFTVRP